jgi:hypothetical protein
MAAIPSPSASQLRQISLSYAMEQARLPGYPGVSDTDEIIISADAYHSYIVDGMVPEEDD